MRFTQDLSSNVNVIRGYGRNELRINDKLFQQSVIVSSTTIQSAPALTDVGDLNDAHVAYILGLKPEVVLLGTGQRQVFPNASVGARFLEAGVGFEVMDTGAACRTFNVLVGEQRQVVALLLL
jgi:uncharacterized protein